MGLVRWDDQGREVKTLLAVRVISIVIIIIIINIVTYVFS